MTNPNPSQILVVTPDQQVNFLLERILRSAGYKVILHSDLAAARLDLSLISPALVILSESLPDGDGLEFAASLVQRFPLMPVVLFILHETPDLARRALRAGVNDYLCPPLKAEDLVAAVQSSLCAAQRRRDWLTQESGKANAGLQRQVNELETLSRLGRSITSSLDIDSVLTSIVDAAVQLTGAEEGSLLLLDEKTGELYVRAARNFNDEFVRTFRLPIQDTLAGSVLRTGQPVLIDEKAPQKIKTSYLVHSLLYVPLQINGHVFGVLGVDNRRQRLTLSDQHVQLLQTMADYAVIAIENARLYANMRSEHAKLETILTRTQDGVILIDTTQRVALINPAAQSAFQLESVPFEGRPFSDIFTQSELLELVETSAESQSNRVEVPLPNGRVFLALLTHIPNVGQALTLHDITYLKTLDRIKSDFVSTVSHDLRSPLTAVLGYVELIERAGPTTDLQREFIQRVQGSVHNITSLVDDLVNLGRIEAGFDTRKEALQLERIVRYSAEGFKKQLADKGDRLTLELPDDLPPIYGNPVQIRQVVDHLMDNAIKYTPAGGSITIKAQVEEKQLILQFRDTGIGIPPADLPFIFDKFYRSSNASAETSGTGLGLAIVKSVIDNHQGRIWVDSAQNKGAVFTVVLPVEET